MAEDQILHCYRHPDVETSLRCYRCGNPICIKCAVRTPVGYLCPDCQRGIKKRFTTARYSDYVIAALVSLVLGGLAGWLPLAGWLTILLSPLAGTLIASLVNKLIAHRYGEWIWLVVAASIVVGGLPLLGLLLLAGYHGLTLLWIIMHQVLAISSAMAILRLK